MSAGPRYLRLLSPHRLTLVSASCLAVAACSLGLAAPLLVERLLAVASGGLNPGALVVPAGLLLGAVIAQAAAGSANSWLLGHVAIEMVRSLRRDLYVRLQRLPVAWYDRTSAGSIISRVMDDAASIQSLASGQTVVTLLETLTALAATAWLGSRSWKLGLVVLAIAPLYWIVFRIFTRRIRRRSLDVRQQLDHVFGHLKQKIDGIQVVRATAAEAAEVARFTEQISALHQPRLGHSRLAIGFSNLCLLLGGVGGTLVFAVGVFEVQSGALAVGELISAVVVSSLIFAPIARLSDLAAAYQQASASFQRLEEILDQPLDGATSSGQPLARARAAVQIEFDGISFAYAAERPVLRNVSLSIPAGQKVAIVGPTGSGKTTLMNLLLRFYEPTRGEIRLGGRPLEELSDEELRSLVGIIPQEPVIFRGTIAENICYGAPNASRADVAAAGRAALVERIVQKLPHGYETLVGEGGHPLSQGERQLIALARLFCKNPQIVVLDEATSALDVASERLIQEALARLLAGRTTVVIAHRLATVVAADRIVVMDQGQIVEQGTHRELWRNEVGLYRHLCDCQFGSAEREARFAPRRAIAERRPALESIPA